MPTLPPNPDLPPGWSVITTIPAHHGDSQLLVGAGIGIGASILTALIGGSIGGLVFWCCRRFFRRRDNRRRFQLQEEGSAEENQGIPMGKRTFLLKKRLNVRIF